jgi:ParB-like chromosome segregation protein Spo0J
MIAADPADSDAVEPLQLHNARVRIDALRGSDSPRLQGEDLFHVRMLAEMEGGLPPIIVHRQTMRVVDGMHRLRAAQLRGLDHMDVRFVDGDAASCFVLGVEANVRHGLPLSLEDRKAAARRIVSSHPQWSDRRIASATGLAARTVASLRQPATGEGDQLAAVRVGRDGRARPVNGAERREVASRLLAENPKASLRAIAREAGVSPETVRNLRARLGRPRNPAVDSHHEGPQGRSDVSSRGHRPCRETRAATWDDSSSRSGGSALPILLADPAVRSTEVGRALLRLLHGSAAITQYRRRIPVIVPGYCVPLVAEAARECAQLWRELADYLDNCGEPDKDQTAWRVAEARPVQGA